MKNQARVDALRRQIELGRLARKSGRGRYSKELKRSVLELVGDPAWGPTRVSKELGLSQSVLYRWARRSGNDRIDGAKTIRSSKMKRVTVVAPELAAARTFELVFPSGAKVTALTWDELSSLVRGNQ